MKRISGGEVSTRRKRKVSEEEYRAAMSAADSGFQHPPVPHDITSNWFSEIDNIRRFLQENFTNKDDELEIRSLQRWVDDLERNGKKGKYEVFIDEDGRRSNFDGFLRNEYAKMLSTGYGRRKWIFPHLVGVNLTELEIPARDVFDLPIFVILYILRTLVVLMSSSGRRSFHVLFSLGAGRGGVEKPIQDDSSNVVSVKNGKIPFNDLMAIYDQVMDEFKVLLPQHGEVSWNGSYDSGTRIMLHNVNAGFNLRLKLVFRPAASANRGHGWTPQVEKLLQCSVGSAVISVRNKDDNLCLIYCVILGLIMKCKEGGARVFGVQTLMVEPHEIFAKGMFMFTDDSEVSAIIRKLSLFLLPPTYSSGKVSDPLVPLLQDVDKKAGTMLSVSEFREEFKEIESKLIPNGICGIDVYGLDFNVNSHVYPLYMSKNRDKVIELLCVTPLDTRCSHYCLIVNMEQLLKRSGGKQFFSCSKCGECFYHRRLLNEHKCPVKLSQATVEGDGGYHYSSKYANPACDIVCGACPKCRLCFTDDFTYEYHKTHCLMQGQTGYRHVQLVTYKEDEQPILKGETIDMEAEDKHVKFRRVLYADFESSIDPETGEHQFMSYGIYDWDSDEYVCGYDLNSFILFILNKACTPVYEGGETFEKNNIYVYFHNAMGYDANFILRFIMRSPRFNNWGIQVIMKSSNRLQKLVFHAKIGEKTKTIHIGDTFLFLTLSLEKIVGSIRKDDLEVNKENFARFFEVFQRRYPGVSDLEIDHILQKNIFPYKFFTDSKKLDTPIEDFRKIFEAKAENLQFFSERVTVEDLAEGYETTNHVFQVFNCKSARDYHDLYLCCDVMQLADVFDRSMKILWESHHIHLTKYLGMPSASWAAFLRHDSRMSIPLYEDTFFAEFFKGMIRGGITSAALRHAVADEKHSIIYLDVNGLYPYVMQKYLFPCGHFDFMPLGWTGEGIVNAKLEEYFEKFEREKKGMCFCVDMHFPDEVKRATDMYPFAPEHRRIFKEYYANLEKKELTPFLKRWSEANNGEMMKEFTGLVCTLYDKTKYNVHWRLLKFYKEHGVKITKVWFGVIFDEGDYLAGYIRKNIEIRNTRKDELGKTLYKLLGNSIYGKTFESPFKRNTYEIVRDPVKLQGLLEEGNIGAILPIDDLGWIVKLDGEEIILDKPTYIGACVCEFAKLHMYTLLYDKLVKLFPGTVDDPGCQMVYTDTDSFILRVRHPDGVAATPAALFAYIKQNDPTLIGGIGGQVKSETGEDETIQEVIALRSKVYAYMTTGGHIGKRAKGTTHDAQEMQLDWQTYKQALESCTSVNTRNVQFVRKTFKIASLDVFRQSLSVNDGKRDICDDGIHTHAFGYPK